MFRTVAQQNFTPPRSCHRQQACRRPRTIAYCEPSALIERVICFFHEGPGRAHQAAKANSAKIFQKFFWPDLRRDVRLYIECCPTCERFLHLGRNPRAGLHSMVVGGRGDCISMDIVGGKGSLPETPKSNNYILTIIDCFTRYAIAIPFPDQSSSIIISAIIGNLITMYSTPRSILTDQGRNLESFDILKYCNLFRIHKLRTTSYHPKSIGVCERFNQTLKSGLRKTLGEHQILSWDFYLNFSGFHTIFQSIHQQDLHHLFYSRQPTAAASRPHFRIAFDYSQWRLKPLEKSAHFSNLILLLFSPIHSSQL